MKCRRIDPIQYSEDASEGLLIYCSTYLGDPPREPNIDEAKRFKELEMKFKNELSTT